MISPAKNMRLNTIDQAEMVWVAPGDFLMGSSDADIDVITRQHPDWRPEWFTHEKPQRTVSLPGYWIYRFPVTVAQFQACCEATEWRMPAAPERGWQQNHPMVNVGWHDIIHYAAWAQADIPTEAQWEKAARGTDGNTWPWGNNWDPDHCSYAANAESTQPVGSRPGNLSPFDVGDMVGNVWEWCHASPAGDYMRTPTRTPQRKSPSASGHVLRGGSWQSAFAAYLRCAFRCFECDGQRGHHAYHRSTVGFRCVITPETVR